MLRLRTAAVVTLVALVVSLTGTAVLTTAPAHAATTNFEIVNKASGKCLDAENSPSHGLTPATNGDPIQLWTCLGTPNQMWHVKQTNGKVGGFPFEIVNNASGKCLDAEDLASQTVNPFVDGDHVQLYSCNGRSNQYWSDILNSSSSKPQPVHGGAGTYSPGVYYGLDAENSPSHGWTPATNGDPVQMWVEKGTSNQLWFIR
jgi:hypothetical protein